MNADVLIVGAGPTGLVLALWLTRCGVKVRLIDKSAGPGETSRAMVVQARTLEFYRQMGFAEEVVAAGIPIQALTFRKNSKKIVQARLAEMGKGQSPFPYVLVFPQDEHEQLLIRQLLRLGVRVERQTELLSFSQTGETVRGRIKSEKGEEDFSFSYLCGCDGTHSLVRGGLDYEFPGGTYQQKFFVADVSPYEKAPDGVQVCLTAREFCLIFPLHGQTTLRVIGVIPEEFENKDDLQFEDLESHLAQTTGFEFDEVHWFSTYHSHHRLAPHFQKGRVFLLGDAAHIHSPAGGQGMNTGIGDAVNLAWKLAAVIQNRAAAEILQTYEQERRRFAKALVASTDRFFTVVASRSWGGIFFRMRLFPLLAPLFFHLRSVGRFMFRLVSQTRIEYRASALSGSQQIGILRCGDRLPYVSLNLGDNYQSLSENDWMVHVYGDAGLELKNLIKEKGFALYEFPWHEDMKEKGLQKNGAYLLRPDGHLAWMDSRQNIRSLEDYWQRWGLRPRRN